ncbi:hypothetical protein INT45_005964 [Circinella minor]|uniref:HIT domain-containing protein n=1 Tax=Circinella minor TaxID=1195481 RepID=A0A8H7SBJ2_9FUNG|nr:hypothetical protein INT45_005964 [Circinella minor]
MYQFGPHKITDSQVFFKSKYCLDVLVISRRVAPRVRDLSDEEATDMMLSAKSIGNVVENAYECTSLTTVIQDGPQAGQTVPHVHMHVIPRKVGDWANNDDIYDELAGKSKIRVDNEERLPRSEQEMKEEADMLRPFFISTN